LATRTKLGTSYVVSDRRRQTSALDPTPLLQG
jgi:hypothetical protein